MNATRHYLGIGLAALFLAGCQGPCQPLEPLSPPALTSGSADFTTVVAMGSHVTAGAQSNPPGSVGLVDRHQVRSYAALFAKQTGATVLPNGTGTFSFSSCSNPGFPGALLRIASFGPPIDINNTGLTPGAPTNVAQVAEYNNLAVPGMVAAQITSAATYASNPLFGIVTRNRGSVLQAAVAKNATFIVMEFGLTEALRSASVGGLFSPFGADTFAVAMTGAVDAIHTLLPNAKIALLTVPDPALTPFANTFPAATRDTLGIAVPLLGPGGVLGADDRVLLTAKALLAAGNGFPTSARSYVSGVRGNGLPLPTQVVLSGTEVGTIRTAIDAYNAAIRGLGQRDYCVVVDLAAALSGIAQSGFSYGTTRYTTAFVTGGLFGLDGVFPNDLFHGILANALIDAVNAKFGSTVPHVNLATVASTTASRARPANGSPASPVILGAEPAQIPRLPSTRR